jgi:hypothetical protein
MVTVRKRWVGRLLLGAALALLLSAFASQTLHWLRGDAAGEGDARTLLYQVSEFHIELLGSLLHEAGNAKTSGELEPLKQALFTATYTHERFVMSAGSKQLAPLESLNELMQLMTRMQLGGSRPLKADEVKTLQEASTIFDELQMSYGKLLSSGGSILSSQSGKIADADEKLALLLKKQLQK